MNVLKQEFHNAMLDIYETMKRECHYNPSKFLEMINNNGSMNTAKILINAQDVSYGFKKLSELRRLDLSVEALILREPFSKIFTENNLEIARKRLEKYNYILPNNLDRLDLSVKNRTLQEPLNMTRQSIEKRPYILSDNKTALPPTRNFFKRLFNKLFLYLYNITR